MDIRSALDALIVIQASLSITSPVTASISRAYKYVPRADVILPDSPAWTNEATLTSLDRFVAFQIQNYTVHSQLLVSDANIDRGLDIAAAFLPKFITAMNADISITQTVTQHSIRGGNPTVAVLDRGGKAFPGLDLFIDIEMKEGATFS